jgi:hypothetical protein
MFSALFQSLFEKIFLPNYLSIGHAIVFWKHGAARKWHRCMSIRTEHWHSPTFVLFNNGKARGVHHGPSGVIQNELRSSPARDGIVFGNGPKNWHLHLLLMLAAKNSLSLGSVLFYRYWLKSYLPTDRRYLAGTKIAVDVVAFFLSARCANCRSEKLGLRFRQMGTSFILVDTASCTEAHHLPSFGNLFSSVMS